MSRYNRPWPWLIVLSTLALGSVAAAGESSTLRTALAVWFLLLCPGLALVGLMRIDDAWMEVTLAVALSVVLDTVVAGAMSYAGLWSPSAALAILAAVSLAGAAAGLMLDRRAAGAGGLP